MFERRHSIGYATKMRLLLSFLLIFHVCCLAAETVYKTVDEDGNIIFTDRPSKGSEKIILQDLQTIKNPNPVKFKVKPGQSDKIQGPLYKIFLITNPADGSGLRSNAGNVTISVSLEPPLRSGHQIIIMMDGKEISKGSARNVSLQNVDRGTHSIAANVIARSGENLISTTSSFSLLRASQ